MKNEEAIKDYAAMTDDQLNREVAERLGYTVVDVFLKNPDIGPNVNPPLEWLYDYMFKEGDHWGKVGDWATDINAAFELFNNDAAKGTHLIIDVVFPGEWRVGYQNKEWRYLPGSGSYYPAAHAVCLCWLAWKDSQS